MRESQLALAVLAAALAFVPGCRKPGAGQVHFAREEVDIVVRPGTVEVTGTYHIANLSDKNLLVMLTYPFPIDSSAGYPDSVSAPGMYYTRNDTSLLVRMKLRPASEDSMTVFYRQRLRGNRARYIVTTARRWQRPIDRAQFRVTVPFEFEGVDLSFGPDRVERAPGVITYHKTFTQFWPAEDIVVRWTAPNSPGD